MPREVSNLIDKFLEFELKNDLLKDCVKSRLWKNSRSYLFYYIANEQGLYQTVTESPSTWLKLKFLIRSFFSVFYLLGLRSSYPDIYILHPRSPNGEEIEALDNYTRFNAESSASFYRSNGTAKKSSKYRKVVCLDGLALLSEFYRFGRYDSDIREYIDLVGEFLHRFDIELKAINPALRRKARLYFAEYNFFSRYFRNNEVKRLWVVDHYSKNTPSICAAHDAGKLTYEFQHGVITKYHIGYITSNCMSLPPGYPKNFLSWGEHWVPEGVLPNQVTVKSIMPNYLRMLSDVDIKDNTLLIISQSVLGEDLARYAISHLRFDLFDRVVFQLHPGEYGRISKFETLFSGINNVIVSRSNFYDFMNKANVVLGVFSTGLIEAHDFGCACYIADLQGGEYMEGYNFCLPFEESIYFDSE